MFLICNKILVVLLIELLLNLCANVLTGTRITTVLASGNTEISGPFLEIEKRTFTRLSITKPHLEHYLDCRAKIDENFYEINQPNLFYTWYRNGSPLQSYCLRRNDFCTFNNGTLRLPPAEKSAGLYYCQVNANAIAVLSESVTVEYPVLKRIPAPANITARSGGPLTFNCPVLSVPPANVTWYHGNVSLAEDLKENRFMFLGNGSLVITNIAVRDDGKYRCLAQNQFALPKTHRQFSWTLTVDQQNDNTATNSNTNYAKNAQLIPQLQDTTLYVSLGKDLRLRCRTITNAVAIEWWYQRVPSAPVEKLSNYSTEYQIQNANVEQHDGYYTCSTPKDKQTFHVVVTIPPSIISKLPSYASNIAASIKFSCYADGNPTPEIRWYHNAAQINSSFLRYITTNELRLISFDSDEEGIYQCFARNIAGEVSKAAEVRLKSMDPMGELIQNPLHNIRCYAHSSTTINITFDRVSSPVYFLSVHIVQSNPHRWTAIAPLEPIDSSYIIISNHLPLYRPFELITRAMLHTTSPHANNHNPNEEPVTSSLRSLPITCCTQGLPLQVVKLHTNHTFVTWPQPDLKAIKYFILQFESNKTRPHPKRLFAHQLHGTTTHVVLKEDDVASKLTELQALNESSTYTVLRRIDSKYADNDSQETLAGDLDEEIYNLVLPANVTGILLENLKMLKMRVLIVTAENEFLHQDFRYVQWKIIENDTSEISNVPFHLIKVESRMVAFLFQESFKEQCVQGCYAQIIRPEELRCIESKIVNSLVEIRSLKPTSWYRLSFYSCKKKVFYGQKDFETLADPPGTISNQRVTKQNGLKLSWDPPVHPNGKIHHYNILWNINNVTHEANVFECSVCFYKFPHVSETAKINITVRVVGENGIGAPIYIDLRNVRALESEPTSHSEIYSGIAIGALLSALCVFFFALLIVCQRRRFKSRQLVTLQLTSQSETHFGNLSNTGIPGDSAGALSGSTLQHEYYEMQTLIPRSRSTIPQFLGESQPNEYQTIAHLSNGNLNVPSEQQQLPIILAAQSKLETASVDEGNQSQMPLCSSTPRPVGKLKNEAANAPRSGTKPYFIPFKQLPQNADVTIGAGGTLQKHSSSPNFQNIVPTSLPLVMPTNGVASSGRRSGSLSSSSASNNGAAIHHHRHFYTNFPKRSNSNDGICLLAEEESSATLTPTSEAEVAPMPMALTNGYSTSTQKSSLNSSNVANTREDVRMQLAPTNSSTKNNNNSNNSSIAKPIISKNTNRNSYKNPTKAQTKEESQPHSNTLPSASIVPILSSVAATALPPTTNNRVTTNFVKTNTPATNTKQWIATAAPTNNLHRRPNVDPNG